MINLSRAAFAAAALATTAWAFSPGLDTSLQPPNRRVLVVPPAAAAMTVAGGAVPGLMPDSDDLPTFVQRALAYLAATQSSSGGWGAGWHAHQDITDPEQVPVDPATTALSAMAFVRGGSTLRRGPYAEQVRRALHYLLQTVETAPPDGSMLVNLTGTQPQAKLGQNIDASMTLQFLNRALPLAGRDRQLAARIERAIDICVHKLQGAQRADGSWNADGWAPVLQSAMALEALNEAKASGRKVEGDVLLRAREYQKSNVDASTGAVRADAAAGVSLYAVAGSQRASAGQAAEARRLVEQARAEGRLNEEDEITEETLARIIPARKAAELADGYRTYNAASRLLQDESVLAGFGNNGGEEFLSYMMTSESLVANGSDDWDPWQNRLYRLLRKVQNQNGSWSGHHCITSPVFSTAAVVLAVTADRDADRLQQNQP